MYDRILYPTDGSEGAATVFDRVRDLAQTYDATVDVLHVTEHLQGHGLAGGMKATGTGLAGGPDVTESGGLGAGTEAELVPENARRQDQESKALEQGTALVEEVAEQFEEVDTRTEVRNGTPHEEILEYAETNDVDIIVMGTHGRTGLGRYMLGSVAERVVRMADVPVLTVRQTDEST